MMQGADLSLQAPNCWHQFQAQMALPKTLKESYEGAETNDVEREDREKLSDSA